MNPGRIRNTRPCLYLVAGSGCPDDGSLEDLVAAAVRGGVTLVQLREKHDPTRRFVEKAGRLKTMLAPLGIPLIINDRIDVALAVGADGVHIGQNDMPYPLARRLMGEQAIIGLSVETLSQVAEAKSYDVDYLGVSAVFPTPTKPDIRSHWGIDGLRKVRAISEHFLVAIGGIDSSNAADIIQAGADGLAVVSAICRAADPERAAKELQQLLARRRRKGAPA